MGLEKYTTEELRQELQRRKIAEMKAKAAEKKKMLKGVNKEDEEGYEYWKAEVVECINPDSAIIRQKYKVVGEPYTAFQLSILNFRKDDDLPKTGDKVLMRYRTSRNRTYSRIFKILEHGQKHCGNG